MTTHSFEYLQTTLIGWMPSGMRYTLALEDHRRTLSRTTMQRTWVSSSLWTSTRLEASEPRRVAHSSFLPDHVLCSFLGLGEDPKPGPRSLGPWGRVTCSLRIIGQFINRLHDVPVTVPPVSVHIRIKQGILYWVFGQKAATIGRGCYLHHAGLWGPLRRAGTSFSGYPRNLGLCHFWLCNGKTLKYVVVHFGKG
jgi:hypothetical protein